jgi:hypothetical protein
VLPNIGIRLLGSVGRADPLEEEGIVPREESLGTPRVTVEYVVTGSVANARDFEVDMGADTQHAGVELVMSVNGRLIQAQVGGRARDVEPGSRLRLRGEFVVIGDYEWEAFDLLDTRASWSVEEMLQLSTGDYLLRLVPVSQSL